MAKIDINKTELVWPGKYNEDGTRKEVPRVNLPFQVIETINESRATREAEKSKQLTLFDIWKGDEGSTFESGWKNKLIWGDNLLVMGSLLEKYAGKIDLIYIDPPFATGANFSFRSQIGDTHLEIMKEQSIIEEKAYRDTWGKRTPSQYLQMIVPRLEIMRELLSEKGAIYIHLDYRLSYLIRTCLDELFGSDNFRNHIIWHYGQRTSAKENFFDRKHDDILFYSKTEKHKLIETTIPWSRDEFINHRHDVMNDEDGREYILTDGGTGNSRYKRYVDEVVSRGKPLDSVWDIPILNSSAKERTGYATQKPEALVERIIKASSDKNDLVADFFCGSGTTLAVAEKLGRRWIGCDMSRWSIHVTRKRLLEIEDCRPFEILNLGKYERRYWQSMVAGNTEPGPTERSLYEYLAFILRLYGAQPVAGLINLHGKKGRAMVHIGSVDAPVTIDEVSVALDECIKLKQAELHVLGWEWEMGLAGPNNDYKKGSLMHDESKKKGVKLLLLQIPRDVMEQQAVDKGDIQFFELAYLEVEIDKPKKLTVSVSIKDFVIPNTELIPEDVREKVSKWSDYIDYWAIDWDFRNDTFIQGWVTYRTRRDRSLLLKSDNHTYEKPGKYRILIKVVDIFGNDTSQAYDVQVV